MDVMDAAYHVVHDYPGGAQALGVRLGKDGRVLSAEVALNRNPGNTAKFGLADAVRVQAITGDYRILYAQAAHLGHMCWPLPDPDACTRTAAADAYATLAKLSGEFGALVSASSGALADGRVTTNELREVRRKLGQLVAAGKQMMGALEVLHGADGAPEA